MGTLRDSLMNDKIRNQHGFLSISTNSKIISTANSGHEIFLTEPGLVVNEIKRGNYFYKNKIKIEINSDHRQCEAVSGNCKIKTQYQRYF
jgi:hypothetical protein